MLRDNAILSKMLYDNLMMLKIKVVPLKYPDVMKDKMRYMSPYDLNHSGTPFGRNQFIDHGSFPLISMDWVQSLSEWIADRKCLEIMAGNGMLSKALQNTNTNIIATDNYSWSRNTKYNSWFTKDSLWCDVEDIDCIDAIIKYHMDVDIIICSWAYMDDTLYKALLKMRELNPDLLLIYIGEGYGGCTADDNFFDIAEYVQDDQFEDISTNFVSWWGIHDEIRLFK